MHEQLLMMARGQFATLLRQVGENALASSPRVADEAEPARNEPRQSSLSAWMPSLEAPSMHPESSNCALWGSNVDR